MAEKQELLERRGLRKMGGENSPISPPLDPPLVTLVNSDARLVLRRNLNGATARESKLKAKLQPWTAVSTLFYTFSFPLQMRSSRFRSNMNTKFLLLVALLMSRISVFQATLQCPAAEKSIGGMFLRGHTFKTTKVGWPGGGYLMCEEEVK